MKFIRTHIALFLVIIMSALCLWSITVALNITAIMFNRHIQAAKAVPAGQAEPNKSKGSVLNISKLQEKPILFNGMKYDDLNGYISEKEEYLVPLD